MPNDVGCPICGKRYFPHSLKIHLPQCQRKWASVEVPCPRCDKPILQGELEEHLEKCRAPRRAALHRRSWNGDTANAAFGVMPRLPAALMCDSSFGFLGSCTRQSYLYAFEQGDSAAECVRPRMCACAGMCAQCVRGVVSP